MADQLTAADFVECTTKTKSRRHWSFRPMLLPLCGTALGYDQAWVDEHMPPRWRERKVIADLPSCRQCEKSRNRLMKGRHG